MIYTKKAKFSFFSLIFGALSLYLGPTLWRQGHAFYEGYHYTHELGTENASLKMCSMVQQALYDMQVPFWRLIQVKKTDQTSCSFIWYVWMNEKERFGPAEYVAYHEAAHIALGHGEVRLYCDEITSAEQRAQEIEADLLAAETLYTVGKKEVILERLAHLQYAIDERWKETDLEDHPSLQEMAALFTRFLEGKGHTNVNQEVRKRIPAVRKLWKN